MSADMDYGVDLDAWHEWGRGQWFLTYRYYYMGAGGLVDVPLQATNESMARVEARKKWKELLASSSADCNPNPFSLLANDIHISYRVPAVNEAEALADIHLARAEYERLRWPSAPSPDCGK